jgi:hypothetical protein
MHLVCVLWLILKSGAADDALADSDCEDELAEADMMRVELLQRSLSIIPRMRDDLGTDTGPSSEQQLQVALQTAKQARHAVLASLQRWDKRIAALEDRLPAWRTMQQGVAASVPERRTTEHTDALLLGGIRNATTNIPSREADSKVHSPTKWSRVVILCTAFVLIVLREMWALRKYEAERGEMGPPWYHDSGCMSEALGAVGLLWLLVGMLCFTELIWFNDDFGLNPRHLTVIDAIYLTAQIVTTVGYGDLTPASDPGRVFMAFYVLSGVILISAILQQLLLCIFDTNHSEPSETTPSSAVPVSFLGKYHETVMSTLPVILCISFGTLFFGFCPGEEKTIFEAFYMTIITLVTVGFGAYHPITQIGKLVGACWMVVGVACFGTAVVSVTDYLQKARASIRTQAATMDLFREIDTDGSGTINRAEFLAFELIRSGVAKQKADEALAKFDELDVDGSGSLDFEEFGKYMTTV